MKILSETETLEAAHAGRSISRFGDGELKLAMGRDAKSQRHHPALQERLRDILRSPQWGPLVCLPAANPRSPKFGLWQTFNQPPYSDLYNAKGVYGSAFITRPDSAPWIDTDAFWERVKDLWRGRDVVLVRGSSKSFTGPELEKDAKSVEEILAPRQHAWEESDALFQRLKNEKRRVILSLGATATVLAFFLGIEGVHALDLGHGAMFMRREGRFDRESFPA